MNLLRHVAIIMDGNGRWGLKNYKSRNRGHREGLNTLETIIKATIKKKIPYTYIYLYLVFLTTTFFLFVFGLNCRFPDISSRL